MQAPYLPSKDADFDAWTVNFSTLITASPVTYGLVTGDATAIAAAKTSWHAAYLLASNPATRTSVTVANKDAERILCTSIVRPYAVTISRDPSVDNGDKTAVGVNLPNTARTPVPPPSTVPGLALVSAIHFLHTLAYKDTSTPTTKAKPPGAIGMELQTLVAVTAGADPSTGRSWGIVTKSPFSIGWTSGDVGKIATYWGRWVTRSGPSGIAQVGPWSAPLSITIV